jgi:hypothetical protein
MEESSGFGHSTAFHHVKAYGVTAIRTTWLIPLAFFISQITFALSGRSR